MSSATGNQRRASIPEVVGAWLHLWTPPRDVVIPPVPWRKLAIGFGAGALVLGVALAVMIPRINDGKETRAAEARAQQAKADAANRARVIELQKARSGSLSQLLPPAGASATEVSAAREDLLRGVESAITADAQARAARGEMSRVKGPTTCEPVAGAREGVFDCYTVVRDVPKVETNAAGSIGYPFRAVLDYSDFTYAFCRVEQFPGEKLVPDPSKVVQLPAACRA
jgi:hypothetical protein